MKKRRMICLLALLMAICSGCSRETAQPAPVQTEAAETVPEQTMEAPEAAVVETTAETQGKPAEKIFETQYISLQVVHDNVESLHHESRAEGARIVERFFMVYQDAELDLFRIYYADEWHGNYLGVLAVDGEDIPVTVDVPEYKEGFFADREAEDLYYDLMSTLNGILSDIQKDDRFSSGEKVNIETEEKTLSYWKFELPSGMELEESGTDGAYQAVFHGFVNSKRYKLYTVCVGDVPLSTVLGTYTVNGISKPVSVESEELPATDRWKDEDVLTLYQMMDSINDVIQTIVGSEGFSEQTVTH